MQLAKPTVDIALASNHLAVMYAFWTDEAGAKFDHVLPVSADHEQYRFNANGSVFKIDYHRRPLRDSGPNGYRILSLARIGLSEARLLRDPDGNQLRLVPPGFDGIRQAAIHLGVRNLAVHRQFYAQALGLPEEAEGRFRAGDTLIIITQSADAIADAPADNKGWRYITFQVMKNETAHAQALANGAREDMAPTIFSNSVRYSIIRDPDGNWIELAQNAALVGSLD